ncbi:MAG: hypothetical protein U5P10_05935 [Spirochaetia bacterium]|nr:hypothetical protein [Spirochaetia bacterium]
MEQELERSVAAFPEPFHRIIDETIEENPYTNLVLLYERLKSQRYGGGMTILRDYARGVREQVITKSGAAL